MRKTKSLAFFEEVWGRQKAHDIARRRRVSNATIYGWKAKFASQDVLSVTHMKFLKDENARPKKLVADSMLDSFESKDLHFKKDAGLCRKARGYRSPQTVYQMTERRACTLRVLTGSSRCSSQVLQVH
jgi:putative transposase